MNLARIAGSALTEDDLHRLGPELRLLGSVPPFSAPAAYPLELGYPSDLPRVAALTAERKSTGAVNYNHGVYLEISRIYLADSLAVVRYRPGAYLHGMAKAWYNYFRPQSEVLHLVPGRDRLGPWAEGYDRLLYGVLPFGIPYGDGERSLYLGSFLAVPGLWLFALFVVRREQDPSRASTLLFLCGAVAYVALVGNSLEVWENQRFRFVGDGFTVVFAALALERLAFRFGWGRAVSTQGFPGSPDSGSDQPSRPPVSKSSRKMTDGS